MAASRPRRRSRASHEVGNGTWKGERGGREITSGFSGTFTEANAEMFGARGSQQAALSGDAEQARGHLRHRSRQG